MFKLLSPKTDEGHTKKADDQTQTQAKARSTQQHKIDISPPIRRPKRAGDSTNAPTDPRSSAIVASTSTSNLTTSPNNSNQTNHDKYNSKPTTLTTNAVPPAAADSANAYAVAFRDQSTKGFHVKIGVQQPTSQGLTVVFSSQLDDSFTVRKLQPTQTILWNDVLFKSDCLAATHLKSHSPRVGQRWRPAFAINAVKKERSSNVKDHHVHDAGDLCNTAAVLSAETVKADELLKNVDGYQNQPPWLAACTTGAQTINQLRLPFFPQERLPTLIINALVPATRLEHLRMLKTIGDMPRALLPLPIPIAIATHLHTLSLEKFWALAC